MSLQLLLFVVTINFISNLMIVKRDSTNYMIQEREDFMYRQLDDTISKQKYIENYEGEDKRDSELFQGEVIERGVRDNEAREIYLHRFD
jgi:hypothetical protein